MQTPLLWPVFYSVGMMKDQQTLNLETIGLDVQMFNFFP